MTAPELLFWAEVSSAKATQRSLAVCYALLIAQDAARQERGEPPKQGWWRGINEAIAERLGQDTVQKSDAFRKVAWDIYGAACDMRTLEHGDA